MEIDFSKWMKAAGLSDQSIHNYLGAVRGRLTTWANIHGLTSQQIDNISDISEFAAISDAIRATPEFKKWNTQGNGMYAAALKHYRSFLDELSYPARSKPAAYGPYHRQLETIDSDLVEPFDPSGSVDARVRVLRTVVQRRGQRKFRQSLIMAYGGRCAISGCRVEPLLEAAHITPYLGPQTNSITNGLLLRADLHTLWDLGLLAVDPVSLRIWVCSTVNDPSYQQFSSLALGLPLDRTLQPSIKALHEQWSHALKQDERGLAA